MVYAWRPGQGHNADPQAVGKAIEDAIAREGAAAPRIIAEEAKDENHAFHPLLEWNDEKAAGEYRVGQARAVIRSVRVLRDGDEGEADSGPAFVHVKPTNGAEGYQKIDDAMASEDVRKAVIREAMSQLNGFRRRYKHLVEFQPVFDALDDVAS
jgi:hypothetical protein